MTNDAIISSTAKRRGTVAEETAETLIEAKNEIEVKKKDQKRTWVERLSDVRSSLYNSEYREFLSRDTKGWFKLAICYCIFYICLASFFLIMLLVFYQLIDHRTPTYYNKESVMNYKGVNPGLGFRPQINPEDDLIKANFPDYKTYTQSLDHFLKSYDKGKNRTFTGAHGRKIMFDYEEIIKNTPCAREKNFGFNTTSPCIVVKLNRIFGWLPIHSSSLPAHHADNVVMLDEDAKDKYVYVLCEGETSTDMDNIHEIEYYSPYPSNQVGGIPFKYFPYRNQAGYLSPLVFVHLKNVATNVLLNIRCKAYAKNIDNTDKLNKRGMTMFQVFINK